MSEVKVYKPCGCVVDQERSGQVVYVGISPCEAHQEIVLALADTDKTPTPDEVSEVIARL